MKKVQLRNAYAWTCDECGRDNFETLVIHENQTEMDDDLISSLSDQIKDSGVVFGELKVCRGQSPVSVVCKFCKSKFYTEL